ncbi:cell division protein FtsI (penicillin-binding protein 3) [Parabacteroides sp. PH5-16]|nr:cell division protein FtsI (penicillin-binding protein 3) [Parabacteroides sp. PH5-8]MDH6359711.1 cell division protein FtsI (penicillin-binding protein 3) [Parabacteroides sp. PH5-16]MDH6375378.1 cell division protein FtsI (penicillin-binding protein 3) [Parabacteroides sp. PH5-33]MDH6392522.1 cell division protein FtsI (penicillin-binding protein 3) [Parabacteroides sp. PFB2-22]
MNYINSMEDEEEIRNVENQGSGALARYSVVVLLLILVVIGIVGRTIHTAFVKGDDWKTISERQKAPNRLVKPRRGNIYSADGKLMATSAPRYYTYMDFRAGGFNVDTFLHSKKNGVDSLAYYLSIKPGGKTATEYKNHLLKGLKSKSRQYVIYGPRVSYADLKKMKQYPFFRLGRNKSGFYEKEMVERQRPFGTLASRTIGDVYGEINDSTGLSKGMNGLELQYDTLLCGVPGLNARRKINGAMTDIVEVEPIDGMDVRTTIDIEIQDITEKSLRDMLISIDAEFGTAMVMEVKTGEIKAITNLGRVSPDRYNETKNHAVADLLEPGSTFKVASIMVALDDGKCRPSDLVDTGNGVYRYGGRDLTDHNRHKGGYGLISVEEAIWKSSNIGVAKTILKGYVDKPEKYVEGLYRLGLVEDLQIEIPGAGKPIIRMPNKNNWYTTALPWMSFGYETQIPPIYTLTFFNAIANNGKMIRPVFTKEIIKDGKTVKTFSTSVVRSSICTDETLKLIQDMLLGVVEKGTGSPVLSPHVRIAGKTGTAQVAEGGSYNSGHQVSFAGYFPADNPKYTCMVVIRRPRKGYPSGGTMSGGVVKNIAEKITAMEKHLDIRAVEVDSLAVPVPAVKTGDAEALRYVLNKLDIKTEKKEDTFPGILAESKAGRVPRVTGMGAKDAVYLLEAAGLQVNLSGMGRVIRQSIQPGERAVRGQTITITLQ